MGLSGQRDKNGQTANKDRDHSTLNTLSHSSPRKVKRAGEGRREEEGWRAGRHIGREWESGTRGR